MILEFKLNPIIVLQKFYEKCGLKRSFNKENIIINQQKLMDSLYSLYADNLIKKTNLKGSFIYSFFMKNDKISKIVNPKNLFPNPGHRCEIIDSDSHAFPFISYKESAVLINRIIESRIN